MKNNKVDVLNIFNYCLGLLWTEICHKSSRG